MAKQEQRGFGGQGLDTGDYGSSNQANASYGKAAVEQIRYSLGDDAISKARSTGDDIINARSVRGGGAKLAMDMARMQKSIEDLARQGKTEEAKALREEQNRKQDEIRTLLLNLHNKPEMGTKEYSGYSRAIATASRQADIEGVELASHRSGIRRERGRLQLGGEGATLSEDSRQHWEGVKETLQAEMAKTIKDASKAAEEGETEKATQLTMRMSSQGNLISEIESALQYNMRQNAATIDKVMGFVGNLAGILSVGQIASRAFIQEPFRYEFMPAMGTLGRSGEIGSMMSSAFTAAEENQVALRQMSLTAGAGGAYAGWRRMRGATGPGGAAVGVGMMALSGVVGSGMGVEMLQDVGLLKGPEDIISAKVAESAVDPQRLMEYYTGSRAGLMQSGAGANMGFTMGQSVESMDTGNTILDAISGGPGDLPKYQRGGNLLGNLRKLGYGGEQIGQYLSSASMQMRGNKGTLADAVGMAGVLEAGYGVSADQSFQNMASLQRAGVGPGNVTSKMYQSMGAVAEGGEVSNYAQNVLVPALNQVVESMAIQNVARSNEELTEEIYGFRAMLGDSNTNLGRLVRASPEAFSRVYGSMVQGTKSALNDPARLAYNLSLGSSFMDVMSGDPSVVMNQINKVMRSQAGQQIDFNNPDRAGGALQGILRNLTATTGIQDPQTLLSLLQVAEQNGGQLSLSDVTALEGVGKGAVGGRREDVEETPLNELRVTLAEQMNAAATASLSVFEEIQRLQTGISTFLNEGKFDEYLQGGIEDIVNGTLEALDQSPDQIKDREAEAEREEFQSIVEGTGVENIFRWDAERNRVMYGANNVMTREQIARHGTLPDSIKTGWLGMMDKYPAVPDDPFGRNTEENTGASLEGVERGNGRETYVIRVTGSTDGVSGVLSALDGRVNRLERNIG